jgi:hypothetical protein
VLSRFGLGSEKSGAIVCLQGIDVDNAKGVIGYRSGFFWDAKV